MSGGDSPRPEGPLTPPEALGARIWLVLGGGGLKGLAHVGVWRALVERDVRIEGIVGTSVGALVGALAASGLSLDEMTARAHGVTRPDLVRINRRIAWINGIRQVSVFRGDTLRAFLEGQLPASGWEALRLPVHMNAVELGTGRTRWFGPDAQASLLDAVHASCALPVIFPPLELNGEALVDGGVEHPVPLGRAAELGATGIIAIDVGAGERGDTAKVLERGLVGVHQRVFTIMSWRRRRDMMAQWDGPPLLYVRPRLSGYDTFDFEHVRYFVEEGYRAMAEALE